MKRLIASLLALAVVAFPAQPAGAELLKNFRLSGQIDVQATNANNVKDFQTGPTPVNIDPLCGTAGHGACGGAANNDRIGDAQTRVMLHLDWDLLDDVHSRITLRKNDRAWGTNGNNPIPTAATTNSQPLGVTGNTSVLGNIFIDEAFFKVDKIAGQFDTTLGRQFYGDPNDIVIYFGPSEKAQYGLPVRAIDAARVDWGGAESISVTALGGVISGNTVGAAQTAGNSNLFGLNISGKAGDWARASLYGWNKVTHNVGASGAPPTTNPASPGGKNDFLYVVGVKGKLSGGGFWVKGEFDYDFGDNRSAVAAGDSFTHDYLTPASHYCGWATMGNIGFKAEDENSGMFSIWGEAAIGSGRQGGHENRNDGWVPINNDYRPGTIYGRFQAIPGTFGGLASGIPINANSSESINPASASTGLNNRVIWGGGVKMSPAVANKLQLAVSWWEFHFHRFQGLQASNPGLFAVTRPGGGFAYNGISHIGDELDVDVTWSHSENVSFGAGWATFQPGGAIYEATRIANITNNTTGGALGVPAPGPGGATAGVKPVMLAYFDARVKF